MMALQSGRNATVRGFNRGSAINIAKEACGAPQLVEEGDVGKDPELLLKQLGVDANVQDGLINLVTNRNGCDEFNFAQVGVV